MSFDILNEIAKKDLLDFSQNLSIARAYPGDRLFPDVKTQNLKAEYLRLSGLDALPTAAMVHALDTEAEIGARPAPKIDIVEKLLIKEKINQSERMQALLDNGVSDQDALLRYAFDDMGRLAESVKTRTEVAKMEVLSTGQMLIRENHLDFKVDFHVPSGNFFSFNWGSPDHDILGDIAMMLEAAKSVGRQVTGGMLTSSTLALLRKNKQFAQAVNGANAGRYISDGTMVAFMAEMLGIRLEINDSVYAYVKPDGTRGSKKYFESNRFALYTANAAGAVGAGLWGVTPEERAQGPWTAQSSRQFITVTQWTCPDPCAVWTKASGLFIPVLPDPDGLLIATISTDGDALEPLSVTSISGASTGTTAISVTPTLESGHSYKYKTGTNLTEPAYNQVVTAGYTNWDGTSDISATAGQKVMIVEVDAGNRAKKVGSADANVKA